MDFNYSPEQELLREAAHDLFQEIGGPSAARRAYRDGAAVASGLQRRLAEQGLLGASVPEEAGGSALSPLDVALIFEAAGQTLLPYPLVETYVAGSLLSRFGSARLQSRRMARLAEGMDLVTVAWGSPDGLWSMRGVQADARSGAIRLYGRRTFVPFGMAAGWAVVPVEWKADGSFAVALVDLNRDGVTALALHALDGSCPLATLDFHGCEIEAAEVLTGAGRSWTAAVRLGWVLLAQEALGATEQVFWQTVEYVKVREQFGQPVGRFQAVKHTAADDYLLVESARVANRYAAWRLAEEEDDAALYAAMAKAYASDMARRVTGDAIQLHGGIGYTWDSDVHLYFKWAWRIAAQLGTAVALRARMARTLLEEDV